MLAAYGAGRRTIDLSLLRRVAWELSGEVDSAEPRTCLAWVAGIMLLLGAAGLWLQQDDRIRAWFTDVAPPEISGEAATPPTQKAMSGTAMAAPATTQGPPEPAEALPIPDGIASSTYEAVSVQTATSPRSESAGDAPVDTVPADAGSHQTTEVDTTQGLLGMLSDRSNAFTTLFAYWQTVYPTDDESHSACERAEWGGLSCISGTGCCRYDVSR